MKKFLFFLPAVLFLACCGKTHDGFAGFFAALFHRIAYFFLQVIG